MNEFVDYYEILQVQPNAEPEVIEKAYKALIFKHHPDRGGREETAKAITGAYYVLSDNQRRRAYDQKHSAWSAAQRNGTKPAREVVTLEEIPPEVIDYILARSFVEGAAATARTAARIAGAAAVVGAVSLAEAAVAGVGSVREARQGAKREKTETEYRQRLAEHDRELEWQQTLQAKRAAETWRPELSDLALSAFKRLLRHPTNSLLNGLSSDELIWLALRHPDEGARRHALEWALRSRTSGTMLVGLVDRYSDPLVLEEGLDQTGPQLRLSWQPDVRSAAFVATPELEAMRGRARRARAVRASLLVTLVMAAGVALLATNTDVVAKLM